MEINNNKIPCESFYDNVFVCEKVSLTRRELESLGFCTISVNDDVMNKIATITSKELSEWSFDKMGDEELEFTFEEAKLYEMDIAASHLGVPYYDSAVEDFSSTI